MARLNWRMDKLEKLLRTTVEGLGYQYWGLEFLSTRGADTLCFYIESSNGWSGGGARSEITAEDCSEVSEHISTLLDIEQPVSGNYRLEVSSPGMARRMFTLQQCETAVGQSLDIRLRDADAGGRRRFTARLVDVRQESLCLKALKAEGETQEYPWSQIERARLVPKFVFRPPADEQQRTVPSAQGAGGQTAPHEDSRKGIEV